MLTALLKCSLFLLLSLNSDYSSALSLTVIFLGKPSDVWGPDLTRLQKFIMFVSSQFHVERYHIGILKNDHGGSIY